MRTAVQPHRLLALDADVDLDAARAQLTRTRVR